MQIASQSIGLEIEWAGEKLSLLPERALWWPAAGTLFIADVHLGKAGVFRAAGLPVPEATHQSDLSRLNRALQISAARRLVILGDLFHAPIPDKESTRELLRTWRGQQDHLEMILVPGNHD